MDSPSGKEQDRDVELPSYAYYSKLPTAGRLVLPTSHQIPYTAEVPWEKKRDVGQAKIAATNSSRSRCLDVDLDEDSGAFPTYVPVTYQLPPTEDVRRRYYNTPVMNDIEDKLDSVKEDISKSISKLMKKGAPCHLCSIYDPHGTVTGAKLCEHFHDRQTKTNYASYDPVRQCQQNMEKLMRPNKPIIPLPRSEADKLLDDDWQGTNPIQRVHLAINKKANAMNIDSLSIRRDKPSVLNTRKSSSARGATRPLTRATISAITNAEREIQGFNDSALSTGKPQPLVYRMDVPILPTKPKVRVPNYVPDGYPATHLLTRRRGYRFVA